MTGLGRRKFAPGEKLVPEMTQAPKAERSSSHERLSLAGVFAPWSVRLARLTDQLSSPGSGQLHRPSGAEGRRHVWFAWPLLSPLLLRMQVCIWWTSGGSASTGRAGGNLGRDGRTPRPGP